MKNRLNYIDEMKGFAILLVCIGHLIGPHSSLGNLHPVLTIIASFHMAFFFFLSGYINKKTHKIESNGAAVFFKKKFISLIIPYLFWLYIASYFLYGNIPVSWSAAVGKLNFYPNVNGWFLPCLFCAMMLWLLQYLIITKCTNILGRVLLYLSSPLFLVAIGIVFNLYFFLIYAIYMGCFLFGDVLSGNLKLQEFLKSKKVWIIVTFILCIAWKYYSPELKGSGGKILLKVSLYAISSFLSCIFFYNVFRYVSISQWIKRILQEWGRMSLVIYLLPIVLLPVDFIFPDNWTNTMVNIFVIIIGCMQCCIASAIGEILMKIPGLSFIMFGKK